MNILAIDTSCDDTSAAVSEDSTVLSNIVSSQDEIHSAWGGVVPSLAKRAHQERIDSVVDLACKRAHIQLKDIDAIAVTYGPGLAVSLEVGIEKAKELSKTFNKPLIAVNHMEGHLLANFDGLTDNDKLFPLITLLVSGGHTELIFMEKQGSYKILGQTLDDAAGEAFDKVARMLGLGYPGGAVLSKLAQDGNDVQYPLTVPMREHKNFMFSFSGIKTAVLRLVKQLTLDGSKPLNQKQIQDIAASFEKTAVQHLVEKSESALKEYQPKVFLLGGGVSSNTVLRKRLRSMLKKYHIPLMYPKDKKMRMDNAGMIAIAAYFKALRGEYVKNIASLDRNPIATIEERLDI